jgi:hypothetical protein
MNEVQSGKGSLGKIVKELNKENKAWITYLLLAFQGLKFR